MLKTQGKESRNHIQLKSLAVEQLLNEGFTYHQIEIEKRLSLNCGTVYIDVYARDQQRETLIECGTTNKFKIETLKQKYADVRTFGYGMLKNKIEVLDIPSGSKLLDKVISWSCIVCNKKIESIYPQQLKQNVDQHKTTHKKGDTNGNKTNTLGKTERS